MKHFRRKRQALSISDRGSRLIMCKLSPMNGSFGDPPFLELRLVLSFPYDLSQLTTFSHRLYSRCIKVVVLLHVLNHIFQRPVFDTIPLINHGVHIFPSLGSNGCSSLFAIELGLTYPKERAARFGRSEFHRVRTTEAQHSKYKAARTWLQI